MDEVTLDGVLYTKASVAAKKYRYTADYVGQLCRAKKIDARMVGRTWYVNLESLATHKKPAASTTQSRQLEVAGDTTSQEKSQKRRVEPVLLNKTARQVEFAATSKPLAIKYTVDDGHLMPEINRIANPPAYIPVEMSGGSEVPIKKATKDTATFSPEALPAVALSGTLSVSELPDEALEPVRKTTSKKDNIASKNIAVSDKKRAVIRLRKRSKIDRPRVAKTTSSATSTSFQTTRKKPLMQAAERRPKVAMTKQMVETVDSKTSAPSAQPVGPQKTAAHKPARQQNQAQVAPSGLSVLSLVGLLLFVVFAGLAVGYFLVASSSQYTVSATAVESRIAPF